MTLGFARRFATYKRPTLLLHDPERLIRLLTDPQRPVQILIAGKAHPADWPGQDMIRQWVSFTRRPEVRGRVIFLSDYDMLLTEQLVNGVDVWINTPRRPWEACGTSGMKVLANGGLNLSELDGWWAEAFAPEVGWALGDGHEHGDDPGWDAAEADSLYAILENDVIPTFYDRQADSFPARWIVKVRQSMTTLTAQFSANRAVRQYTTDFYVPAAQSYAARQVEQGAVGIRMLNQRQALASQWPSLSCGDFHVETQEGQYHFKGEVNFGGVDSGVVLVELYADDPDGSPFRQAMTRGDELPDRKNVYVYTTQVEAARPAGDFTVRLIPKVDGMAVPLELNLILWQH